MSRRKTMSRCGSGRGTNERESGNTPKLLRDSQCARTVRVECVKDESQWALTVHPPVSQSRCCELRETPFAEQLRGSVAIKCSLVRQTNKIKDPDTTHWTVTYRDLCGQQNDGLNSKNGCGQKASHSLSGSTVILPRKSWSMSMPYL